MAQGDGSHGGYRRPENPAPVSGPGALSARTDGGAATQPTMVASGGPYGSRQEMENLQGSAPMQGTPPVPFGAASQFPDEPVTAGAPEGPGFGPEAAGIATDSDATLEQLAPLVNSLELMANLPSATPETRAWVRVLKARMAGRG